MCTDLRGVDPHLEDRQLPSQHSRPVPSRCRRLYSPPAAWKHRGNQESVYSFRDLSYFILFHAYSQSQLQLWFHLLEDRL